MSADLRPAFGRRRPAPGPPRPAPAPQPAAQLSAQAQVFAAQIAAEAALRGCVPDSELDDWKRSHRARMWGAAGPWKYWACILGAPSLAGRLHDFGPAAAGLALVVSGLASACGVMALWRGLAARRG